MPTLAEINKMYQDWSPDDDELDEICERCRLKAYSIHLLIRDLHPLEQMIMTCYLMAVFVDNFKKTDSFQGLVEVAEDLLLDIRDNRDDGAEAGAGDADESAK